MVCYSSKLLRSVLIGSLTVGFMACSEKVAFNELESTARPFSPVTPAPLPDEDNTPPPQDGFFSKTQEVEVDGGGVDILFVVDNSGSMLSEQAQLSKRISGFMDIIQDLNWQIAMTTTDPSSSTLDSDGQSRNWGDGEFRPFDRNDGQQYLLKTGLQSDQEAQRLLAKAIHVGSNGGIDERGIHAVYRAIERRQFSPTHSQFFRPDSSLVVVLISDEDECSKYVCKGPNVHKSSPQNLQDLVTQEFGEDKKFNFHSIMWIPNDNSCRSAQNMGNTYQTMSLISDGIVGSICENNYSNILGDIGNKVVELVTSVNIDCAPDEVTQPGTKPRVLITLGNGDILLPYQYKLKGKKLTFNKPLPEGKHTISYLCPQKK